MSKKLDPYDIRVDELRTGDEIRVRMIHLPTGNWAEGNGLARHRAEIMAATMRHLIEDYEEPAS